MWSLSPLDTLLALVLVVLIALILSNLTSHSETCLIRLTGESVSVSGCAVTTELLEFLKVAKVLGVEDL